MQIWIVRIGDRLKGGQPPDVTHCQTRNDGEARRAKAVEGIVRVLLVVANPHIDDRQRGLAPPRPQQIVRVLRQVSFAQHTLQRFVPGARCYFQPSAVANPSSFDKPAGNSPLLRLVDCSRAFAG